MQKLLLLIAVGSLFMVSCNNEVDSALSSEERELQTKSLSSEPDFQIVNYAGEGCIQFRNDSVYNEMFLKLTAMSEEETNSIFSELGFVSQQQIVKEADVEQAFIVDHYENDLNRSWPYQQIKEFKQKYKDVCMFNPFDSTDFVANCKVRNVTYRSFVNRQGVFLIGDSVVQCPVYTSEELFDSPIKARAKNEVTDENSIDKAESKYQIPSGDFVKVRALWNYSKHSVDNRNYTYIDIDFLSQKKKVLWKKHSARIRLYFNASATGAGLEIYDKTHMKFDNQNNRDVTLIIDTYDKINVNIGRFGEDGIPSGPVVGPFVRFSLKGKMAIWSNEIPETNKGLGKLDRLENW